MDVKTVENLNGSLTGKMGKNGGLAENSRILAFLPDFHPFPPGRRMRVGPWNRGYTLACVTEPEKKRRIPRHLWWGVWVPLLLVVIAALLGPNLYRDWQTRFRFKNERMASRVLRMLATAEEDFREFDRDGNGVLDYWTGDVAGLWRYGQLIPLGVAEADASPLRGLVNNPVPYYGYYFVVLRRDLQAVKDKKSAADYGMDTDNSGRKVHHLSRFAFCAYPASPGLSGYATYMVDENFSNFKRYFDFDKGEGVSIADWPSDQMIQENWGKYE